MGQVGKIKGSELEKGKEQIPYPMNQISKDSSIKHQFNCMIDFALKMSIA
jgi:hypothetical protein